MHLSTPFDVKPADGSKQSPIALQPRAATEQQQPIPPLTTDNGEYKAQLPENTDMQLLIVDTPLNVPETRYNTLHMGLGDINPFVSERAQEAPDTTIAPPEVVVLKRVLLNKYPTLSKAVVTCIAFNHPINSLFDFFN